ncbi:MAG: four helix bundle protein [Clostridia bacterium]|nr:four helix bundle protein [Clostridia bacterium]
MNNNNPIEIKSFKFAVRSVNLYKHLSSKNEFVLSKQFLRAGTSIGANVSEAQRAQSMPDFHTKMNIALKEANETHYWLRLLTETDYITNVEFSSMENDLKEILALLTAICKTTDN